jgi:hypothetical protein
MLQNEQFAGERKCQERAHAVVRFTKLEGSMGLNAVFCCARKQSFQGMFY